MAREVDELVVQIRALGSRGADGKWSVPFGVLFDATTEIFEALAGTLKAAKKRGRIDYAAPILLKGTGRAPRAVLPRVGSHTAWLDWRPLCRHTRQGGHRPGWRVRAAALRQVAGVCACCDRPHLPRLPVA